MSMQARMAAGMFLALGFADLAVLNLLLAPRLSALAAAPSVEPACAEETRPPLGASTAAPGELANPGAAGGCRGACPPTVATPSATAVAATVASATAAPEAPAATPDPAGDDAHAGGEAMADIVFELGSAQVP